MVLHKVLKGGMADMRREDIAATFRISVRTLYRDIKILKVVDHCLDYLETLGTYPLCRGTWQQISRTLTPERPYYYDMVRELEKARRGKPPGGKKRYVPRIPPKNFLKK